MWAKGEAIFLVTFLLILHPPQLAGRAAVPTPRQAPLTAHASLMDERD